MIHVRPTGEENPLLEGGTLRSRLGQLRLDTLDSEILFNCYCHMLDSRYTYKGSFTNLVFLEG